MDKGTAFGTMAAAVAVVLLMCLPVMPAFAAGNSTIVSAESNAVAGEYFSVGICSYTPASGTLPDTFDIFDHTGTMADSEPLGSHPAVYYDATGTPQNPQYTVISTDAQGGRVALSDENTYIYIADSNPGTQYSIGFTLTSTNTAYSVLTFHLKHYDVQSDNDIVSGGSLTLTSGTAVRIQISAEIQYSGSTVPTDIPMEFTVTSVQAHGTYLTDPGKSITLLAGNISIVEQIDNLNPGTGGGATFQPTDQDDLDDVDWSEIGPTEYVITEIEGYGTSHPGCHAIDVLGNSDGVAKDGKANFSFRIPTNKMFVLELIPGSSLKSEKLALQVQYVPTEGEPTTYGMTQVSLNNGTAHSILCRNGTDIQVQSQVSNLAAQYWFPAMNSGSITITLQNQGNGNQKIPDDVHMYLVFRDAAV